MQRKNIQAVIFRNTILQAIVIVFTVVLIANLNAIVDSFLHPEIPYFDDEHLIVGGITGLVSGVLISLVMLYARHLEQALSEIKILKSFLPICSSCRKIRTSESNEVKEETWESIESYISEHTTTKFSHGICPECKKQLYPELSEHSGNSDDKPNINDI